MTSASVRRATPADAAAIAAVHVRTSQVAYRGIVPDDVLDGLSAERRRQRWQELLERRTDEAFTLVAQRDERVAGFCSVIAPGRDDDGGERTAEIAALYVDPDCWHEGLGTTLVDAALEELPAQRWADVTLWVFARNDASIAFYRRVGFAPDGAELQHEDSGQREIRLRLSRAC